MNLLVVIRYTKGEFFDVMNEKSKPIEEAGTKALTELGTRTKAKVRAHIRGAGFSQAWANAFRFEQYPSKARNGGKDRNAKKRVGEKNFQAIPSLNSAIWLYHAIPYAEVFESGARIKGKPTMWIPMSGIPKKVRGEKMTPERFVGDIGRLFARRAKGGKTILWANMRVPKKEAAAGPPYNIRIAALRRASQPATNRTTEVSVPVFVGVNTVQMKKRFNIKSIIASEMDALPSLYLKFLEVD